MVAGATQSVLRSAAERIGESDCETLGDGWFVQPVNATTSLAYVVVAAAIVAVAVRRPGDRVWSFVYAASVAAIGAGSVLFHGPQPGVARELHDLPIAVTLAFMVVWDLRVIWPGRRVVGVLFALVAVGLAVVAFVEVGVIAIATGVLLLVLAVLEVVVLRRGLRASQGRSLCCGAIIGIGVLAGSAWLLGRTDSPACDPDGVFQFHGVWHLLSALVLGLWWWVAMRSDGVSERA